MARRAIGGKTVQGDNLNRPEGEASSRQGGDGAAAALDGQGTRRRPNRVLCVAIVVATVAIPLGLRAWGRVGDASDRALTAPNTPPWRAAGVTLTRVEQTDGLHAGDLVMAVDGVPLESWVGPDHQPLPGHPAVGDRLTYRVLRDGQVLDVAVVLRPYAVGDAFAGNWSAVPLALLVLGIAGFVFLARPTDRAAQVLLVISALIAFGAAAAPYVQVVDLLDPIRVRPYVAERIAVALMWGALFHFALVFPEPWVSPRWRRRVVAAGYAGPFVLYGVYLAVTLPVADGTLARLARLISVSYPSSKLYPFVIVFAMVRAYRSALGPENRQRLKWVMVSFTLSAALLMVLGHIPSLLIDRPLVPARWLALLFLPCPIVVGASILRYRLFDIQVILKRSLLYGALTAGVFGLYFVALAIATRTVGATGLALPLFASAVVAAGVPYLRDRLQHRVSRVVYGARDDPREVVSRLLQRAEGTAHTEGILPGIAETLALALRLPYVAIELQNPDGTPASASFGESTGQPLEIELVHRGEVVGRLLLEVGSSTEPFGPADQRLLDDVARQVAATAHEVLLHTALKRSLERAVGAREEERRRLRRDLHDELGPTLAASAFQLSVAREMVSADPAAAESAIDRVGAEIHTAIADVRGLAQGLGPAMLDELGLVDSIRQRASALSLGDDGAGVGAMDVTVEVEGDVGDLPAAVEVAAYCIVMEAMNNAARHGRATACTVRLVRGTALGISVRDNGGGLPAHFHPGVGLPSMRERAAELGGSCDIGPAPSGGTTVDATIPFDRSYVDA